MFKCILIAAKLTLMSHVWLKAYEDPRQHIRIQKPAPSRSRTTKRVELCLDDEGSVE